MPAFYGLQRSYIRRNASGLYPHTIEVRRSRTVAGTTSSNVGLTGYSGMQQAGTGAAAGEEVLYVGIPASIQARQQGRKKDSSLASDAVFAPTWHIYVPANALAEGTVRDRDIIVDDRFYRYEVAQAYWNLLGHRLICIRLEA
jgi:hypothetical protein